MPELLGFFNVSTVDILGFFAGACILTSMILRKVLQIKVLLLIGSLSWLTYGVVQHLLPIVVINAIISTTGIIEITRLSRKRRNADIGTA